MQVQAKAKSLRIPPRKMSLVASLVRGRSVIEAMTILEHTPRRAAKSLREVIRSAQANAEHNFSLETDQLRLSTVIVSPGFVLKRARAASRGTMHRIRHRTSNVMVVVESPNKVSSLPAGQAGKKSVQPKPTTKEGRHGPKS